MDTFLPTALVHVIVVDYLGPLSWAVLIRTCRGWDTVAQAAVLHPWSGRARQLRALYHGTASAPLSLSETMAVLHHCSVACRRRLGAEAMVTVAGASVVARDVAVGVIRAVDLKVPPSGAPNEATLRLRRGRNGGLWCVFSES